MTFKFQDAAQCFQWQVAPTGEPLAEVEQIGDGRWLTVCPLCGCAHEGQTNAVGVFTPICVRDPLPYQHWRKLWLDQYPQAGEHRTVLLVTITPQPLALAQAEAGWAGVMGITSAAA